MKITNLLQKLQKNFLGLLHDCKIVWIEKICQNEERRRKHQIRLKSFSRNRGYINPMMEGNLIS